MRSGIASNRRPVSKAMTSASVDEWLTAPCFLHSHDKGQNVLGPLREKYPPVVLLESFISPAKEASLKSNMLSLSGVSPI